MTDTSQWPSPPERPGSHVEHGWRCPRSAPIVETMKRRLSDGESFVVSQCTHCGGTDAAWRLLDPEPPDAA